MGCRVEAPKPCSICNPETEQGKSEEITEEVVGYTTQDIAFPFHDALGKLAKKMKDTVALVVEGRVFEFTDIADQRGFHKIFRSATTHRQILSIDSPPTNLWVWECPAWLAEKKLLGRLIETLEHLGEDLYYFIHIEDGVATTRGALKDNQFGLRVGHTVVVDED